jgi:hypothetical protein
MNTTISGYFLTQELLEGKTMSLKETQIISLSIRLKKYCITLPQTAAILIIVGL